MFCTNCGKEVNDDVSFCPYCGMRSRGYIQASEALQTAETIKVHEESVPAIQENLMFCRNCGSQIDINTLVCSHCGVPVQENVNKAKRQEQAIDDEGGFNWGFLGFLLGLFLPIVAIVLNFCWYNSRPKTASAISTGAWLGFLTGFFLVIILLILFLG